MLDRPDPPTDVRVVQCSYSYAEIAWEPGNENHDAVIAFHVYYNTSFDAEGVFHEGAEVSGDACSAKVRSYSTMSTMQDEFLSPNTRRNYWL